MAGSVSRARYKRRPKGNFLTGVITRPCVHTSSPATFPQLLAQLALPGLDAPSTVARDRVLATDSTDSNASAYRSIKPFRHQCLWKCHRSWKEWFFSPDDWNFFFFFSFVRSFVFVFFFRRGIRGRNFNDWNTLVRYIKSYFHRFHGFYSDSRKELIMIIEKNTWFYKLCVWCCLIHRFLNCNFFFYVVWLEKELL